MDLLAAMYGKLTVEVKLTTRDFGNEKLGGGRKLTPHHNTRVSAVGVLRQSSTIGELFRMDIYHNVWAEYPLCPRMFFPYTKRHHVPYSPRDFGQIAGLTDDLFREAVATARQRLDIPFTPEEGTYVSPQFGGPHVRDNVPTAHAKRDLLPGQGVA